MDKIVNNNAVNIVTVYIQLYKTYKTITTNIVNNIKMTLTL